MKKFLALFGRASVSTVLLVALVVLGVVVVATFNRKSPLSVAVAATTIEATVSSVPQTATAFQTATVTPIPTSTPIPPGVTPAGIPPTLPAILPTPLSGYGHVTGRVLCTDIPKAFHPVSLILIEGNSYSTLQGTGTDVAGRWLLNNLPPKTYAVVFEPPESMPTPVFTTVTANQITDLGDISLPPEVCE